MFTQKITNPRLAFALICTLGAACSVETSPATAEEADPQRGVGKADGVFGSCLQDGEPTCGGPAAEGNCFCDDACADFGDCCADKVEMCGGDDPDPAPALCLQDDDCLPSELCNHDECLSGCGAGEICPAVCFGQCEEAPPCAAPPEYAAVDGNELLEDPSGFDGMKIALSGEGEVGFPICTQLACLEIDPCCNACGADLFMSFGTGSLRMNGLGCGGNNCDVLDNCDYGHGEPFTAWGTLDQATGLLVDGHCGETQEPDFNPCDECGPDQICEPICPPCAPGSPPEACECASHCVDAPPSCFDACMLECDDADISVCQTQCFDQCTPDLCNDDAECGDGEICDQTLCIPSCPVCLDCNGACVQAP